MEILGIPLHKILMAIGCVSFFITMVYVLYKEEDWTDNNEHPVHHDHRKGSFYNISQQVRRDEKKDRGY